MNNGLTMLPSILVISNKTRETITVICTSKYVYIMKGLELVYKEESTMYRCILFMHCKNCEINISSKMLKLSVMYCSKCNINVNSNIIGTLELFKCKSLKVCINKSLPLLSCELCNKINIYQSTSDTFYMLMGLSQCSVNKLDNVKCVTDQLYIDNLLFGMRVYVIENTKIISKI